MKKLVLLSRLFDEGRALLEGKVQLEEHFCDDPMQRLDAIKDADALSSAIRSWGRLSSNSAQNCA